MAKYEYSSVPGEGDEAEPNPLAGIKFTLDEREFECQGYVSPLESSELALAADDDVDPDSAAGQAMLSRFLRMAFGEQEYRRLKRHIGAHHTPWSVVYRIVADIEAQMESKVEDITGRPTDQSPGSSPGRQAKADRMLRVISLGTGDVQVMPEGGQEPKQDAPATVTIKPPARRRKPAAGRGQAKAG